MPTRKPKSPGRPELTQAVASLRDAAQHVRNAVKGRIDTLRGVAASEIGKAKAALLKKTGVAQDRVETVLKKTEDRLHKAIVGAQNALDKAVAQAEKRSMATAKTVAPAAKRATKAATARKAAPAKKARATK
ncbi:MAG: hypothetical protein HZC37_04045 [Burkholderiales bacterium]|nr:hypothetical protein [Burkholderiales bacterium]